LPGYDDPLLGTGVPKSLRGSNGDWDLAKLNIKMRFIAHLLPWIVAVVALAMVLIAGAALFFTVRPDYWPWTSRAAVGELRVGEVRIGNVGLLEPEPLMKVSELLTVFLAGIGLAIGFQQWHDARKEASLEKYYERLDLANRRMEAIYAVGRRGTSERNYHAGCLPIGRQQDIVQCGLPPAAVWIYTELDNLEYVLQKYQLGYVDAELMKRALGYFSSLCREIPLFADTARAGADPGSGSGYRRITKKVIHDVANAVDQEK